MPTSLPSASPGPTRLGRAPRRSWSPNHERQVASAGVVRCEVGGGEPRLEVGRLPGADQHERRQEQREDVEVTGRDHQRDPDQRDQHAGGEGGPSSACLGEPGKRHREGRRAQRHGRRGEAGEVVAAGDLAREHRSE
nr:hypothetical protein [Tessaracoccus flavescens]